MKQRILTAIFALIVFVPFTLYGDWPFTILVYLLATIGIVELLRMHHIRKFSPPFILSILFLWIFLLPSKEYILNGFWYTKIEIFILFIMILLSYTVLSKNKFTFDDASFVLFSVFYVTFGFYFLIQTRDAGLSYILFALFIIWATDTGAYFLGKAFGKRKLWPEISPNKTIEGAIGGIVVSIIVGLIFQFVSPFPYGILTILIVSVLVSIVGQIGDLVASAFKRHYNIKDTGNILPGHGGILDRLDSLIFVLPFLHLIHFVS